ncbi:fused protease/ribonucleoside-triphosphate reductase [Candidatus Woesearchaeota archaeon]|jgi:adenosylcobalamin-dependent ribonucleoside-triphosphate reductase|nr:fused protease/ribonucleoside-triphosphate reductase [Candidatus Woesearchaeota archaeon]MBT3438914.1 fused protease/ribonucleoside-triphosphate reductase [Candidatus Woesearchaeota archaeon]MBT4058200.1 fused protease/ribonucleoside-triphosphate reductase [Candidatus Woesearchaeota archaeon]MBT4206835.1 fused protease/ribonucleoside-triphosphate reductase [Candidatus Woesearchaeota archaeon]MBT4731009.1 fused protease/ribonucleoside-triphosphate reductase [Candidatus Woesearchaeota archaeon
MSLESKINYTNGDLKNPIQSRIVDRLNDASYVPFELDQGFVNKYQKEKAPFGFNGLGEITFYRTYSRIKEDGSNENWADTIERVVNGTYNMQKRWIEERGIDWSEAKAQDSAQEMYDRMFNMKFLPPGRGLWGMGSAITEERGTYAALNNCAFVSTENLQEDYSKPFTFLMDASMLGVGVGFDTKGAGKVVIRGPDQHRQKEVYDVPDSREGWVKSVGILLDSYFLGTPEVEFGYGRVRKEGELIKGFGGKASGPGPLKDLHESVRDILNKERGRPMSTRAIVDVQNLIGKCVIAGNVRRTAEISFGDPFSDEYLDLKNYEVNPEREAHGWASNNSVFAELGMDYSDIAERIRINGEPGLAWLDNMKEFGRMNGEKDHKDHRAGGGNPCLEQTLESYELCCLVENFPNKHESKEDFLRTLKFSYLYAKTVTLGETHWPETNRVLLRNRRIGCSVSGIAQFISDKGIGELETWLNEGYDTIDKYDEVYSDWLCIPRSIKTTSVKPSGTVSLLAGSTPGVHFPASEYYIRRVRLAKNSDIVGKLVEAGYPVEPAVGSENTTLVTEIPVHAGTGIRTEDDVSMWEQLGIAAFMQKHWADNQISCTVKFDPETEGKDIQHALDIYQSQLKGISFLPKLEDGAYPQMPYEPISKEEYEEKLTHIKPLTLGKIKNEKAIPEKFCDGDTCALEMATEEVKTTEEVKVE